LLQASCTGNQGHHREIKTTDVGIIAEDFTTEQSPEFNEQYTGRIDVYTLCKSPN